MPCIGLMAGGIKECIVLVRMGAIVSPCPHHVMTTIRGAPKLKKQPGDSRMGLPHDSRDPGAGQT